MGRLLLLDGATPALAILVGLALALVWPWLPRSAPGGQTLARYGPLREGSGTLLAVYDGDGRLQAWESENVAVVSGLRVYGELRTPAADAVLLAYRRPGEVTPPFEELRLRLVDVQIREVRTRQLDLAGQTSSSAVVFLRDGRGELAVGSYDATTDRDSILDPPMQILPADLHLGRAWESTGRVADSASYHFSGRVVDHGPFAGPLGTFDDCLAVESRYVVERAGTTVADQSSRFWYCAGVGLVESQTADRRSGKVTRRLTIATDTLPPDPATLPPAASAAEVGGGFEAGPEGWTLTRIGRVQASDDATGTTPAVWIGTDPPLLVAAAYGGDLVAFDPADVDDPIRWRFRAGGAVHGRPTFDPERGRIYFGASDKRLYALDARGLFLWSFETGDNVAGCTLVAGDVLIVGSEDRVVYGLNAATGSLRWRETTGGAVTACPTLAQPVADPENGTEPAALAIVGSDDGGIYALDPASGEQRWLYVADRGIEAPIVHDGGMLYVASLDGSLAALEAASGEAAWVAPGRPGTALRTAPTVGPERLFIVDDDGLLTALDRGTGRTLWSSPDRIYVGPPVLVGESLILAGRDGDTYRLDLDGTPTGRWPASEASSPLDYSPAAGPAYKLGPTLGGGAVWLADASSVLRRLGPPVDAAGPTPFPAAWSARSDTAPFSGGDFLWTPADYRGTAIVLDSNRRLSRVDPATGTAMPLGVVGVQGLPWTVDPLVVGDTLLAAIGDRLEAVDLPTGRELWSFQGGLSVHPAATADGLVLRLGVTEEQNPAGGRPIGQAVLHALDLATGDLRWQVPLGDLALPGGVVARDGAAFLSTPPARLDLATGATVWRLATAELALGRPLLDPSGDLLYVGLFDLEREVGRIVALDAANGVERWHAQLGSDSLNPPESPWMSGSILIVPALSGQIVALDTVSGAERWRHRPAARRFGGITVADGRVWLMQQNGRVVVLDVESGRPIARYNALDASLGSPRLLPRPALVGDAVIVPMNRVLLGFEAARLAP